MGCIILTHTMPPLTLAPKPAQSSETYRADIDGLRGLAVIAVVGFHAFPTLVPGGFVGVDVFFVISGYLISGIIIGNLDRGTFSFREFYYRRIKRIFPALIIVLVACFFIGWLLLPAREFAQLGKHIASAALFIPNIMYWREAGYFNSAAEFKPLLHLWSLGVEEQFYLVWPFLLWAARKQGLNLGLVALCLAIPSFLTNVVQAQTGHLAAAFFLPGARFWELMVGALLACSWRLPLAESPGIRGSGTAIGLVAACLSIFLITRNARFPGWWALLPTIGTALIIAAGPHSWLNRTLLSHRVLVSVGLVSYPLYLWHWPLLSFAWIVQGETPLLAVRLIIVALSFLLAWATYQAIERPIRFGSYKVVETCAVLGALLLSIGLAGFSSRAVFAGFPFRANINHGIFNEGEIVAENGNEVFYNYQLDHFYLCTPKHIQNHSLRLYWPARCLQSKPSNVKNIAIIGDSHAEDLFVGLAEGLKDMNIVKYIHTLPTRGTKAFDEVFNYVESDKDIRVVILTAFWNNDVLPGTSLEIELTKTVSELVRSGKSVYLVDDRPNFPFAPTVCKYVRSLFYWHREHQVRCEIDRSVFDQQRDRYLPALTTVAKKFVNAHLIDTSGVFCDERVCRMAKDHVLFFRDVNHLTLAGSRAVANRLISVLSKEKGLR